MHLAGGLFGFWRQSIDRRQSIFCVYNISDKPQLLTLADLNLINTQQWFDLVANETITEDQLTIELEPYQSVWLSNIK